MRSGSRPNSSFARAAAALLVLALGCGGARAQQPPGGDLGLRSGPSDPPRSLDAALGLDASSNGTADATLRGDDSTSTKKPKRKTRAKADPAALPPLKPYKGAERSELRGGLVSSDPNAPEGSAPVPGPTIAAIPAPPLRRRIAEDENPYDPVGERVGDLKLTPYVEQDVGWASNPNGVTTGAVGSGFETTEVGTAVQSDWSRNDLHGQLKGGYTDYFKAPTLNGPYGSGALDGRYDVSKDLSLDAEGRFSVARETLTTLGVTAANGGASAVTTVSTYGATVGGAQKFGDLTLALHGTFDRTTYGDETDPTGGLGNLAADDYNDFGVKARASYRLSDVVSPFVELDADERRYDASTDAEGFVRNSTGLAGKAGLTIAYSPLLTGEASVGYGRRQYQDPRLPDVDAPLIDAALIWSATPLTTLTLKTQTQLQDSILAGASADISRGYTIDVAHALTRQVKLDVTGGYTTDDYVGVGLRDSTLTIGAGAEYHLSREVVIKASATRSQFTSSAPNSNYIANVFMLGLRLQR